MSHQIGSLSSAYAETSPLAALPNFCTRDCTQSRTQASVMGMLLSLGSLLTIFVRSGRTPFPQSGSCGSVLACWPYLATEKLHELSRVLATHPITGTVQIVLAPA